MDFNQIQELIRLVSKYKIAEFSLKEGDTKLTIRNQAAPAEAVAAPAPQVIMSAPPPVVAVAPPVPAPAPAKVEAAPAAPAAAPAAADADAKLIAIKSPMVGTFYRAASPEKPPYVKIGDSVDKGQTVCMIEAMKLFNEIESDVKGKIVKVLVEDASPVEYDQPLFLVDPS
ncbi:MAG: acetyl-CoA carboxylase biotin carboxyl carrier protein [Saprospiraceae bacterium]